MTYAAGILYQVGDRVLLLKRGTDCDHPNTWGLPAGKIEPGETPLQGACRESMEEVGLMVAPDSLKLLQASDDFYTFGAWLSETFEPVLNSEHSGSMWAPLSDLPQPVHPGLLPLLQKLQAMTANDTASARQYDGNGWFEVKANPISKVGIFPYSGAQLGLTGADASRIFQVYRPAEELANPECIESFKLIPWVDNHTAIGPTLQKLTDSAVAAEAKGVHGVVGEDVFFKDGTLYANIKAFSNILADLIAAGKRELSAGYRCVYDMVSGVFEGQHFDCIQRNIRGNHLALVKEGRMGPDVAVMDSFTFTIDSKDFIMPEASKDEGATPGAGGMTLQDAIKMLGELAPQVAKLQAAMSGMAGSPAPAAAAVEDTTPAATAGTEAMASDKDTVKPAEMAAMDAALKLAQNTIADMKANGTRVMLKEIAVRDALVRRLTPHIGAFDHAEMTLQDAAVYGCEKLGVKVAPEAALPALEGFLTASPQPVAAARARMGMDAANGSTLVSGYLTGTAGQ